MFYNYRLEFLFAVVVGASVFATRVPDRNSSAVFFEESISKEAPKVFLEQIPSDALESFPVKDQFSAFIYGTLPDEVQAFSVLIADLDNGTVLFSKNAEKRWLPASITKLMTALVALEDMGLNKKVRVSEEAAATEGTAGELAAGEEHSVSDLVKIMFLTSSNDAAEALAGFYGRLKFIAKMNDLARRIGMRETEFIDPTGLSNLNQSTASDIRSLADYFILNYWDIFRVTAKPKLTIGRKTLQNINQFAGREDFFGGKTGYLEEAKRNLVSLFKVGEKKVLFIVLGSPDHYADTETLIKWLFFK